MSADVPTEPANPRPTGLIVALVVLVIAALGLGGWLVFGPGGLGGQATSTPTTQGRTSPSPAASTVAPSQITPSGSPAPSSDPLTTTVRFDPWQGDAASAYDSIAVFGVWEGVAVIRLANQTTGDILRGFDIRTGELQWTLSHLPDGSAFTAAGTPGLSPDVPLHWNGTMAVVLQKLLDPDNRCPAGAYIEIVPLRLDRPTVSTYVDSGCTGPADFTLPRLAAYDDGVVVVNQWHAGAEHDSGPVPGSYLATMAYANTDLTRELWHVDGPRDMATDEGRYATDPLLWHTLALTAAGTYVGLHDGTPSTFAVGDAANRRTYFQVGDGVVELPTTDPALTTVTWWNSPTDTQPAWTFSLEPGWSLQPPAWCASSDVLVVQAGNGAPTGEAVALDVKGGGGRLWTVSGLSLDNGWYAAPPCAVNAVNLTPVVVFGGRVGTFYDALTGAASPAADWRGASPPSGSATAVFQCKGALTCAVWDAGGPSLDVAIVEYGGGAQPVVASSVHLLTLEQYSPYPSAFSYEGGMVAVGQPAPGQYVIVLLTPK